MGGSLHFASVHLKRVRVYVVCAEWCEALQPTRAQPILFQLLVCVVFPGGSL